VHGVRRHPTTKVFLWHYVEKPSLVQLESLATLRFTRRWQLSPGVE
jgi:hypothetical protein